MRKDEYNEESIEWCSYCKDAINIVEENYVKIKHSYYHLECWRQISCNCDEEDLYDY